MIKKGWLVKQGGFFKNFQKRWFELRGNVAHYYVDESKTEKKGDFSLLHTQVSPNNTLGKPFCIQVSPESGAARNRTFYLIASDTTDQEEWINALMRASVWEPGIESLQDVGVKEHILNARIKGMLANPACFAQIRDILSNLKALDSGINSADFDPENELIRVEGSFNASRIVSTLEEAGYFVYPCP